jgi:uncharacterized protein
VKTTRRTTAARPAISLVAAAGLAASAAVLLGLEVPALEGRVNDQAGLLDAEARARIEQKLAEFESETGSQVAVLTLPSLEGESIEDFSIRVVEAWQLGREGVDDGVLLLVARDERQLRLEVGYGLEGRIPDALARRIVDDVIVPRLQEGDFAAGIEGGVEAVQGLVRGQAVPPEVTGPARPSVLSILGEVLGAFRGCLTPIGVIVLFVAFSILERKYPRLFAKISSSGGSSWSSRSGGSSSSSSSSSRSSSGGSRSFSGGGGRFGGGGASGRW